MQGFLQEPGSNFKEHNSDKLLLLGQKPKHRHTPHNFGDLCSGLGHTTCFRHVIYSQRPICQMHCSTKGQRFCSHSFWSWNQMNIQLLTAKIQGGMSSVPLPPIRSAWALQAQRLGRGYQETTVPCFLEF